MGDNEEYLNSKGLENLKIYFTNLAGFDKMSWNDRLYKYNEVESKFSDALLDKLRLGALRAPGQGLRPSAYLIFFL
jgi:hypothetical protein